MIDQERATSPGVQPGVRAIRPERPVLLRAPAINELAQAIKSRSVNLCPLRGSQPDRALHQLFAREFLRPACGLFWGFHGFIIRDSKSVANAALL